MKSFILIILSLSISVNLLSQEIDELAGKTDGPMFYYDKTEVDINASLRFIFPVPDIGIFSLVDFSVGIGYGLIPGYYYVGIAGDVAIGLDWFALFSEDKDKDKDKNDVDKEYNQIGFSFGGRIYNSLRIFDFRIMPFFGCDFLFIFLPMPYAGMEISFKIVGFEYAYYLPLGNDNPIRHQISLKFHLPKEY
jgi:hypothetical protein